MRILILSMLFFTVACGGTGTENKSRLTIRKEVLAFVEPSMVTVEITLQYDRGESPDRWAALVTEERPLEVIGFAITDREIVIADLEMHSRFIKKYEVVLKGKKVGANVDSWFKDKQALVLRLDDSLEGLKALEFDALGKGPYYTVNRSKYHGTWTSVIGGFSATYIKQDNGEEYFRQGGSHGPIVDKRGKALGFLVAGEMPMDWKVSPLIWPRVTESDRKQNAKDISKLANAVVPRVTLNFRSARKKAGDFGGGRDMVSEMHVSGVVYSKDHVLVLASLKPQVTALLEKVTVHIDGKAHDASFVGSFKDYGALRVKLKKPVKTFATLGTDSILKDRHGLYYKLEQRIHGKVKDTFDHQFRFSTFEEGWKKHLYSPYVSSAENTFVFTEKGVLTAFPLSRRKKASEQTEWGGNAEVVNYPAFYIAELLEKPAKHMDGSNVPVKDEEEARLAWLGIKLQPLNQELARFNKVSKLSNDGRNGAIVTYVYPGSPAAKAKVKAGMILLRLHVLGEVKPLDVRGDPDRGFVFPWKQYDRIPEVYYDRIPTPWKPVENSFTRQLTNIGFGKKFKAEFFVDGAVQKKDFKVVKSPKHYDTVSRYKNELFGITVRDMSYELRRYFHKKETDPGVVISKIEVGSKVSVAGVKPYEIITQVDGKDVFSVKEYKELIQDKTVLNLTILRMANSRSVKVK
jgi:S1-C subfamily serine protease